MFFWSLILVRASDTLLVTSVILGMATVLTVVLRPSIFPFWALMLALSSAISPSALARLAAICFFASLKPLCAS